MIVKTPILSTLEADGYAIKIHAATYGLFRKVLAAGEGSAQMDAIANLVDSVAEIDGENGNASDLLSVSTVNKITEISLGNGKTESADFSKP